MGLSELLDQPHSKHVNHLTHVNLLNAILADTTAESSRAAAATTTTSVADAATNAVTSCTIVAATEKRGQSSFEWHCKWYWCQRYSLKASIKCNGNQDI
jgi:hypothetical protein